MNSTCNAIIPRLFFVRQYRQLSPIPSRDAFALTLTTEESRQRILKKKRKLLQQQPSMDSLKKKNKSEKLTTNESKQFFSLFRLVENDESDGDNKKSIIKGANVNNSPKANLQKNVLRYNQLIGKSIQKNSIKECLKYFEDMKKNNVAPNIVTYNNLIHIFVKNNQIDKGLFFYKQMKLNCVEPNLVTFNLLLEGL
eukprot:Pgem_evm1s10384